MRLKDKIKITRASHGNLIIILPGYPKDNIDNIKIHVIAVPLESGENKYLATNIFNEAFTVEMFK